MAKLNIGIGGVAHSAKSASAIDGIKRVRELGLDHMELEFVYGVKMNEETAQEVAKIANKEKVNLTVHGPYFVNLASDDNRKFYGSIKYITDSLYIGGIAGAKSVTFHPAFYQKRSPKETFELVKKAFDKIFEEFEKPKYKDSAFVKKEINIAPELTGKPTQFGDLEELIKLTQKFKGLNVKFCIDFAHKFARSNGKYNTYEEFVGILDDIEKNLGKDFLDEMHMHVSAIHFGEKGEKNHLTFLEMYEEYEKKGVAVKGLESVMKKLEAKNKIGPSELNWKELLQALKDKNVGGYLVCESPILEMDALLMQKFYKAL